MAKKKPAGPSPARMLDPLAALFRQLLEDVMVYERGRYGTVNPEDARKPAVDALVLLRDSDAARVPLAQWSECLLSIFVAAQRAGHDVAAVLTYATDVAEAWREKGNEPLPALPFVRPGTADIPGTV